MDDLRVPPWLWNPPCHGLSNFDHMTRKVCHLRNQSWTQGQTNNKMCCQCYGSFFLVKHMKLEADPCGHYILDAHQAMEAPQSSPSGSPVSWIPWAGGAGLFRHWKLTERATVNYSWWNIGMEKTFRCCHFLLHFLQYELHQLIPTLPHRKVIWGCWTCWKIPFVSWTYNDSKPPSWYSLIWPGRAWTQYRDLTCIYIYGLCGWVWNKQKRSWLWYL